MIVCRVLPTLKSVGAGRFEGLAWSFAATPDSDGDILLPSALATAAASVPIPVKVEHKGADVGVIEHAEVTPEGLTVAGQIDTASEAYTRIKSGDLSGLSIAFRGDYEQSGPVRVFKSASLVEVSVCRAPVNTGSRVTAVKAWSEVTSEAELHRIFKSTGMPGRLAQKCAAAAWPVIQKHDEADARLKAALRQLAGATNHE